MSLRDRLRDHAKWAEGVRNFPYEDTVGKLTIGVGRNLDDRGLSDDEVNYLLANDIDLALAGANTFPWFQSLDEVRQMVVADMIFNLGLTRFRGFIKTIAAIAAGDYEAAADEMEDSRWYRQTGRRAIKNVRLMRYGFDTDS